MNNNHKSHPANVVIIFFLIIFLNLVVPYSVSAEIIKIHSLSEIETTYPKDTIIFFDIDDTLIDSPYMLGSKAWRKYIEHSTSNLDENWHDIFSLFVARNIPVITVETITSQIVLDFQNKGYSVCGLTARERDRWYDTPLNGIDILTIWQLELTGIRFDHLAFKNLYPELACAKEFFQGVFFANIEEKGKYLKKLMSHHSIFKPTKIVFIDDKLNQVKSVASCLNSLKIDSECFWYCAADEKANRFNPLIANIQLYYLCINHQIISDQEAKWIVESYPEKDAHYYLQSVIDHVKKTKPKDY